MSEIIDPVAVVTGGSGGIGSAIVAGLQEAGHRVATLDRTARDQDGVQAISCDITDPGAVDAAFRKIETTLGPPTVLVANSGIVRDALLARADEDDWNAVLAVNLTGAYRLIRRGVRNMIRQRFGRIVLIGSVTGLHGSIGQTNYAASKAGLIGLARSTARELGPRGITCNVVAPGFIQTPMTAALDAELVASYRAQIPIGRLGTVDDVAGVVRFLCSEKAGYITGAIIPVDGGMGMGY